MYLKMLGGRSRKETVSIGEVVVIAVDGDDGGRLTRSPGTGARRILVLLKASVNLLGTFILL